MKQIVLLIAIYSLIIHQAHKDYNVKPSRKQAEVSKRFSSIINNTDRKTRIDHGYIKPALFKSQTLSSTRVTKAVAQTYNQFIWPEQIQFSQRSSPAYYPFQ